MRISVVSHSYVAAENMKNLTALASVASVQVILPNYVDDRVLGKVINDSGSGEVERIICRRISLPRAQYLLASIDMGLRDFRPDIVHVEYDPWAPIFWQTVIYKVLFARRARIVCTVKKNTYRPLPAPLKFAKAAIARFLLKRVSKIIAVSKGVRKIYQREFEIPGSKITVLQHLGVDTERFAPAEHQPTKNADTSHQPMRIGYCGRLDENKGVAVLLDAFRQLRASRSNPLELHLLGAGSLAGELSKKTSDDITIVPPVPHHQVPQFLKTLDIFVMPALITPDHEEHDGHALMEAMSCAIACVGTTSGIIPELLADDAGIVCEAGSVEQLIDRLDLLIGEPDLRRKLGQRARRKAIDEFSIEAIAEQKLVIYEGCIA